MTPSKQANPCEVGGLLGWVLAQIAFPLHASEISDKSETGKKKTCFSLSRIVTILPQNVTFFGKDVTKNVTS